MQTLEALKSLKSLLEMQNLKPRTKPLNQYLLLTGPPANLYVYPSLQHTLKM